MTVGAVMTVFAKPLVILGPTASGKSALAMTLASRFGAHILSADSMQVYRGMDIGTAKPTTQQRTQVLHHGIDVVEPSEVFTVANFVELADATIHALAAVRTPMIVTGGTPLYYKALFEGLFNGPGADEVIRSRLRGQSNDELHARLRKVDPAAGQRIHIRDTRRLIRALEVFELTGTPISALQTEWQPEGHPCSMRHNAVWIGLQWDREALNRRINARVTAMINEGWLEETRRVLNRCGALSKTACEATGYHELSEHLCGRMSLDEAIEQIKIGTRQLARRQMKWFRRFRNVTWLAGERALEGNVEAACRLWGG